MNRQEQIDIIKNALDTWKEIGLSNEEQAIRLVDNLKIGTAKRFEIAERETQGNQHSLNRGGSVTERTIKAIEYKE